MCTCVPEPDELEIDNNYVKEAVKAIFSVEDLFRKSFGNTPTEQKSGHWDIITETDKQIELDLIEFLKSNHPDSSFILEEGDDVNNGDLTWIIDPIDGTMNYSHGVDYCGISVGVEYDGELLGGAIFLPERDELYYAVKNEGAYRNNSEISTSNITKIEDSLIEADFHPSHINDYDSQLEIYQNIISKSQGMRAIRSGVAEFTSLADGRIEAIYDSEYSVWDIAAAVVLVKEAGGEVYDKKTGDSDWSDIKEDCQLVATNGEIEYDYLIEEFDPNKTV